MPDDPDKLRFYFDYLSHNAYIAWVVLRDLARKHEREVVPVPVLFAGLLNAHGSVGPAEVRAKARWMGRDVIRKAIDLGIPIAPAHSHPFRPLLPLRVSGLREDPKWREKVVTALFEATWVHSLEVSDDGVVASVLDGIGLDGDALVAESRQQQAKDRLRRETERAIAAGVFGVPTMIVDGRLFWGSDDLVNVDRYLSGDDPVEGYDFTPWGQMKPTASRTSQ